MRNMRQVFENRLKDPTKYEAPGAKNEIDIARMGNQFQGFGNYPKIDSGIENNIKQILKDATDPHHPQQAAYAQHVQNAIKAASESIKKPVAAYPDATIWVTKGSKGPGSHFKILGTVGNNTFYGAIPEKTEPANPGPKPDHLEGKSHPEKLRHYAAQARADAAKKPMSPMMKLHQNLMQLHQQQHPYAPIPNRAGAPAKPASVPGDAGAVPGPQTSRSSLQRRVDEMLQKLSPEQLQAVTARGAAALHVAGISAGQDALTRDSPFYGAQKFSELGAASGVLPAGFYQDIANSPALRAMRGGAASFASLAGATLPSIAPRISRQGGIAPFHPAPQAEADHAPGANTRPHVGPHDSAGVNGGQADLPRSTAARQRDLKRAVAEYFDRQARLPPSGGTAFDPRLTPAWPGLNLPG
jgi:hypothetical protein